MDWLLEDLNPVNTVAILSAVLLHLYFKPIESTLGKRWPQWTDVAGGFAVGYVFLQLLPKLSIYGTKAMERFPNYPMIGLTFLYGFMLLGVICYWLIDLMESSTRHQGQKSNHWRNLQALSFFLYNVLMGELITGDNWAKISDNPLLQLLLFSLGVASILFHLAGMNHIFHHWDSEFFQRRLRWIQALGILCGAVGGTIGVIATSTIVLATAFIGGAILINVIYYEIPRVERNSAWPFLAGIAAFAIISILFRTLA